MRYRSATLTGWLVLCIVSACAPASRPNDPIMPRDPLLLETHVQPYLDLACASIDCHGGDGRPLRLYSELGRRAQASLRPQPISNAHDPLALTKQELSDNCQAFAGVELASGPGDKQLALRKPLAASAGGMHHIGGVHWADKLDPGYLCLRGFLVGDITQDLGSVCAEATAKLQP